MNAPTRRAILGALPALAAVPLASCAPMPVTAAYQPAGFSTWCLRAQTAVFRFHTCLDEPGVEKLTGPQQTGLLDWHNDHAAALKEKVAAMPATTLDEAADRATLLYRAAWDTDEQEFCICSDDQALLGAMINDVLRLAGRPQLVA